MDEKSQNKKHQKHDPEWEALKTALKVKVPESVENKLNIRLEAFRKDLNAHPSLAEENQQGSSWWLRVPNRSPNWFQFFALAGTAVICIVLGVYFFVGSSKPTWAEVSQSFNAYPFHAATAYVRDHAFSETQSVEFWIGQGDRIRVLEGSRITFAQKGGNVRTFDLDTRKESYPGFHTLEIMRRRGFLKQYDPHPSTSHLETLFSGRIDEMALARINDDSRVSKDMVVFEVVTNEGQWGRWRNLIWVVRSSKLPIRISSFGSAGMRIDVIYSYFKEPTELFFDPTAFEAKLKDRDNSAFDLMYIGLEDILEKRNIPLF